MTSLLRTLGLAVLLAGLLAVEVMPAGAQPIVAPSATVPDSSPLEFHGFRAGAPLQELQTIVRQLDGASLRCDRSKVDPRVSECRAVVNHPQLGGAINLWVSAVDSVASVITLSSAVEAERLDRWRQSLERRYGRVNATVQGSQWMMQWVRRGRMLRLTWRVERGEKIASISLIDGRVLDAWGAGRGR